MSETEFSGVLDLSGADTSGFKVPDTGTYDCEIFDWERRETKDKPGNKMPAGQPIYSIEFKIIEEGEFTNAHCWTQYTIPPADYDEDKRNKMLGMLVRFFTAAGMEESDVKSKKFNIEDALNNLIGEPIQVSGKKEQKYGSKPEENEWQFNVVGVKPAGSVATGAAGRLT